MTSELNFIISSIIVALMHLCALSNGQYATSYPPPPAIGNGVIYSNDSFITVNGSQIVSAVTYTCMSGFTSVNWLSITRSDDGSWPADPNDCVPDIPYGIVSSQYSNTDDGDPTNPDLVMYYAEYKCNDGTVPPGYNIKKRGVSRKWPRPPRCEPGSATDFLDTYIKPPMIDHGLMFWEDTYPPLASGDMPEYYYAKYACYSGYTFSNSNADGTATMNRSADSTSWPIPPQCFQIIDNGYPCNQSSKGSLSADARVSVTYCCNNDSILLGNTTLEKALDDVWPQPPFCLNASQQILVKMASALDLDNLTTTHFQELLNKVNINQTLDWVLPNRNDTLLTLASRLGHVAAVRLLIDKGANVSFQDSQQMSPLELAARRNHSEIVRILLKANNSNVNAVDSLGFTPLLVAVKHASLDIVKQLLDNGADASVTTSEGNSTLILAAYIGSLEKMKLLLGRPNVQVNGKNNQGETALTTAAQMGYFDLVSLLVETWHADISVQNANGFNALYLASSGGFTKIASFLLDKGADIDEMVGNPFQRLMTALFGACMGGHTDTAEMLLKRGADITKTSSFGESILLLTAYQGNNETLKLLLSRGASIDVVGLYGYTPLMVASSSGKVQNARILLSLGASVNSLDDHNNTALIIAASRNRTDMVKLLLAQSDIDSEATNDAGENALIVSLNNGNQEIAALLIEHTNISVNSQTLLGDTPLLIAAGQAGMLKIVKLLVKYGARVNARNVDGFTPFLKAANLSDTDTMQFLLDNGAAANAKASNGWNALMMAASTGQSESIKYLFKTIRFDGSGDRDIDGNTSLIIAASSGQLEAVQTLTDNAPGLDVNARNKYGDSAASVAAKVGSTSIVQYLMKKGASTSDAFLTAVKANNFDIVKKFGGLSSDVLNTGLQLAAAGGFSEMVDTLINAGASVFAMNENKLGPLHLAALNGNDNVIQQLIHADADVSQRTPSGETALHLAVKNGFTSTAKVLVDNGADISLKDNNGMSPLALAVQMASNETVHWLLNFQNIDANSQDNNGNTVLMYATVNDTFGYVDSLLQKGANINATNNVGYTALDYAICYNGTIDTANFLLNRGITTKSTSLVKTHDSLIIAAQCNRSDIALLLLNRNLSGVNATDNEGNSAFFIAARNGFKQMMTTLYIYGADVNSRNKAGYNALMYLAINGNITGLKTLRAYHPAINSRNKAGDTAIGLAAARGNADVVKLLLQYKAEIGLENSNGDTPLSLAVKRLNNSKVVELLLNKKANVHVKNLNGDTPLIIAATVGDFEVCRMLIDKGADIHVNNSFGDTALNRAAANGNTDIVSLLLNRRASLEVRNDEGFTPYLAATANNHLDTLRFLVYIHNADINARTATGDTSMTLAASQGNVDIINLLYEQGSSVNMANNLGMTPLLNAANNSQVDSVRFFLGKGAIVDARESVTEGTALLSAARNGNAEIVKMLIAAGADIRVKNFIGRTPLMLAAYYGHLDVVKILVQLLTIDDINATDMESLTALLLSSWSGHEDITAYLIANGAPLAGCALCFFTI